MLIENVLGHFIMPVLKEKSAAAEDLFSFMTSSVPTKGDGRSDQKV